MGRIGTRGGVAWAIGVALAVAPAAALPQAGAGEGVDVTMPLVEQALRFLETTALAPPPEGVLLKAGALRVCGADLSGPGCRAPGLPKPSAGATGPEAAREWRAVLESALAAASLREGAAFDKVGFERYVVDAMTEALGDPTSFYLLPAVYRKIASIPESFVGFGMSVAPDAGALVVTAVHRGSPAWDAGLVHGDRIVRVNGQGVTGYLKPMALAALWGADGEKVRLSVARKGGAKDVELIYQPWSFTPFSVERFGDLGVVRVRTFGPGLAAAVRRALESACLGLVVDLRDASGGGEEEMVALADLLLGEGKVGSREPRDELGRRAWAAAPGSPGERLDVPIAVAINGGTSGLAEVLAAALRAHGRAILVGRRTAGIDTLETLAPLPDGSAIQVASTRLLGPDRLSLAEGVEPHVETERLEVVDLALEIVELSRSGRMDDLVAAARAAVALP
jgi:carboxyl-terminal processing protease